MKKIIGLIFIVAIAVGGIFGYKYYSIYTIGKTAIQKNNVTVNIPEHTKFGSFGSILEQEGVINSADDFLALATFKKWNEKELPFHKLYIEKNWNTYNELVNGINFAINHNKDVVDVVINNVRNIDEMAGKVSSQLNIDSTTLSNYLHKDSLIQHYGFTDKTFQTMFLPNTYEFYYNTTPKDFVEKMAKAYKDFWNADRIQKAKNLHLSQSEVTILASIVYEEQKVKFDEQPKIAGLYINRLKKGMLLQADPTVKFAWGDPSIKRLLFKHLEINSPYNTYKNIGLPPGPISMPEPRTIDAVLDYENHEYLFMCAKPEYSGYHNFSKTLSQHNKFAKEYQNWLSKEGIH